MSGDVGRMRELLALSLRASEPQRSAAEQELQQLQHAPISFSFLSSLLAAFVTAPGSQLTDQDADVQLLFVLWLKQQLKLQWRKAAKLLTDDERARVRDLLLFAALHEPQPTVALHLALVVAAIARAEFPAHWAFQSLFQPMLQPVQRLDGAVDLAAERRGLEVCYRVVKELAARRLMQHRKQFAMLSVELLPLLLQYWTQAAAQLNGVLQTQRQAAAGAEQLRVLETTTKLISTMLLDAFRDLSALQNGELMRSALVELYNQLERLVTFRQALLADAADEQTVLTLDKCMHRIAAIVVGVQNSYPMEFREYLTPYLALFWNVLNAFASAASTTLPSPRRLQIDALQFFANVLSCRLYKNESLSAPDGASRIMAKVITATGDVALTDVMVLEAQAAVQTFMTQTDNRFASMLNMVVMHYMTLTATDLDEWQSDPEAYCTLMGSLTAKESVRACAENVFLTLLQNFPDQTIPALTQMTSSTSAYLEELGRGQVPTGDDRRILDMDAVLLAVGLGCYDLHDCFEFEPWFLTNLVPILVHPNAAVGAFQGLPVLRYRIVWLVSCWLAQLSAAVRPPLYDALLNPSAFFHQDEGDVVLKLRIIQTLESMVNDWGFEHDAFAPFLPRALQCLFALFPQADESESKMKVLGCLEAIVQACGARIATFCHQISAPLPALWTNESDASNLVRGKTLQLMAKLLASVKDAQKSPSDDVHVEAGSVQTLLDMCVQVVRLATDVSNPDEVFLMEGGLELWNETLDVSTAYTEELHVLFGNVLRLMERDYEHVALVLTLVEQYVRLGKAQFWHAYHTNVSGLLQSVMGNVKADASLQIAQVTEKIIATSPVEQVAEFGPVVKAMVEACVAFQQGESKQEPETVLAGYLSVVARLLTINLDLTLHKFLLNDRAVLLVLVDAMLRLFYTVGSSPLTLLRRKVWTLALWSTLMLGEQPFLERTGQVVEICVEVMEEEQEEHRQRQAAVSADRPEDGARSGVYRAFQAHHKAQQQQPSEEDAPILALDLRQFVCERLNELSTRLGPSAFEQLLRTVDSSVLRKFQS